MIAVAFSNLKWETYEKVSCLSKEGSRRRVDIITIEPQRTFAMIIDLTTRMESSSGQAADVAREKLYTNPVFLTCPKNITLLTGRSSDF